MVLFYNSLSVCSWPRCRRTALGASLRGILRRHRHPATAQRIPLWPCAAIIAAYRWPQRDRNVGLWREMRAGNVSCNRRILTAIWWMTAQDGLLLFSGSRLFRGACALCQAAYNFFSRVYFFGGYQLLHPPVVQNIA